MSYLPFKEEVNQKKTYKQILKDKEEYIKVKEGYMRGATKEKTPKPDGNPGSVLKRGFAEGQVWECANGEKCGIVEIKDNFMYLSFPDGTIRMYTDEGKHSKEYDLVRMCRSFSGMGVKINESPSLHMQMIGRAKRNPCKKTQALRAVYGYLHCDDFGIDDIDACKQIIKDALNKDKVS